MALDFKGRKATVSSPNLESFQRGIAEIKRLKHFKATSGPMFVAELEIQSVESTADVDKVTGQKTQINPVKSTPAWKQPTPDAADHPGLNNVLGFFMALTGKDENYFQTDAGAAEIARMCPESETADQPAEFLLIGFETWTINTAGKKGAKHPFTKVRWTHIPLTPERSKAIAAAKAQRVAAVKALKTA